MRMDHDYDELARVPFAGDVWLVYRYLNECGPGIFTENVSYEKVSGLKEARKIFNRKKREFAGCSGRSLEIRQFYKPQFPLFRIRARFAVP